MRELVQGLVARKRTRRAFLTEMMAAGYTLTAARSALASVSPFVDGAQAAAPLTRTVTGTGGELLAEQLIEAGAKYLFVSNGSGLGALCDALVTRPQIQLIQATHEGQVVAIADGYAKASGRIGFGMYSRIGLPHSSSNMYNSMKDRTAVVLLSDHADTDVEGTDAHEDIDDWLEPIQQYTKWRWVAHQPERIPEWLRQACKVSTVMPNGPAYVRIPRDLMYRENVAATVFKGEAFRIPMELRPDTSAVERAARTLLESSSPLLYVGPEVTQCDGRKEVVALAELLGIPVVQHRSFFADFPTSHPLHVGEYGANMRFPASFDCLVNLGARTGVRVPAGTSIIHASVDPVGIGRETPLTTGLLGDIGQVARDLAEAVKSLAPAAQLRTRAESRLAAAKDYTSRIRQSRLALAKRASGNPVPWQRLVVELNEQLDKDAVIVEELGTEGKVLNFFDFADDAKIKIGRTEGRALGWGTGAAAGVQLALPNRQVVSLQGDGGFLFGQTDSLWTHSRYDLPILTVVFNNHSYEEVRWNIMSQGASGKAGRDYISYLGDPDVDFTKLAAAYNIEGAVVKHSDELAGAIQRAIRTIKGGRPFMLDVHVQNTGAGAEVTWYPKFSLADVRERRA